MGVTRADGVRVTSPPRPHRNIDTQTDTKNKTNQIKLYIINIQYNIQRV